MSGISDTDQQQTSDASHTGVSWLFQKTKGLKAMEVALGRMVASEKEHASAFLEALEKAPHIVASESNPAVFLRFENENPVAASRRLLTYWMIRREIFGPELAFKSVLSGEALTANVKAHVFKGSISVSCQGESGRSVLYLDPGRREVVDANRDNDIASRPMVMFYCLSLALTNPKSQSDGVVFVIVLTKRVSTYLPNMDKFHKIVSEGFPLKVHSCFMACCPPRGAKRVFTQDIVPFMDRMLTREHLPASTKLISSSPAKLCEQLVEHGFEKSKVPTAIGGTWENHLFGEFAKNQITQVEQTQKAARYTSSLKQPPVTQDSSQGQPQDDKGEEADAVQACHVLATIKSSATEDMASLSCCEQSALQRSKEAPKDDLSAQIQESPTMNSSSCTPRNVVASPAHSPRSKPKSTSTTKEGSKTCKPQKKQASSCQKTGQKKVPLIGISLAPCRVEAVDNYQGGYSEESVQKLNEAMETVPPECFDRGVTDEEIARYVRKRNAVYSKRKYYKRKLRFESLVNSKEDLEAQNKLLKAENERLEQLHKKARIDVERQYGLKLAFNGTSDKTSASMEQATMPRGPTGPDTDDTRDTASLRAQTVAAVAGSGAGTATLLCSQLSQITAPDESPSQIAIGASAIQRHRNAVAANVLQMGGTGIDVGLLLGSEPRNTAVQERFARQATGSAIDSVIDAALMCSQLTTSAPPVPAQTGRTVLDTLLATVSQTLPAGCNNVDPSTFLHSLLLQMESPHSSAGQVNRPPLQLSSLTQPVASVTDAAAVEALLGDTVRKLQAAAAAGLSVSSLPALTKNHKASLQGISPGGRQTLPLQPPADYQPNLGNLHEEELLLLRELHRTEEACVSEESSNAARQLLVSDQTAPLLSTIPYTSRGLRAQLNTPHTSSQMGAMTPSSHGLLSPEDVLSRLVEIEREKERLRNQLLSRL